MTLTITEQNARINAWAKHVGLDAIVFGHVGGRAFRWHFVTLNINTL